MNHRLFQNVLEYDELASTNAEAKLLLTNLKGTNFLVWAKRQTAGRGQRGNSWHCGDNKDLAMSFVFHPKHLIVDEQFVLNMLVCNGVRGYIASKVQGEVQVKWPNDILINGKKVCGILIENALRGAKVESSIIGIGLNLNSSEMPVDLPQSTSIMIENPGFSSTQKEEVYELKKFLELELLEENAAIIKQKYLSNLFGFQKVRKYLKGDVEFEGVITGVSNSGLISVLCTDGEKQFDFKGITFLYS
jgi:BirA family biotin operon repressor/biotin-[acetyl-CoA-carboxylase] ligase